MPSSAGSPLGLASTLRGLDDERLLALLRAREVRENGVRDFFDLAERLLDRSSVHNALVRLDRCSLLTLAVMCQLRPPGVPVPFDEIARRIAEIDQPGQGFPSTLEHRGSRLADRALLVETDEGYLTFEAVCEVLRSWPGQGLPGLRELAAPLPEAMRDGSGPEQGLVDAAAAERAFLTSVAVLDLIEELDAQPVRELARGGAGVPDLRRISVATGVELASVPVLLRLATSAGLVALSDGTWGPTDAAAGWMAAPAAARWTRLARAWSEALIEDVRFVLTEPGRLSWGRSLREYLIWSYPAADERLREQLDQYVASSELLGIVALQSASTPGSALLEGDAQAAERAMSDLLPAEVERVYLQNDLTVIAPGPLPSALHERLRGMAVVDARGLATTYRITAESLAAALERGETEQSILEFLERVSLSGIPQPLRYLVTEAAGRHGLLRVGAVHDDPAGARGSYVRSRDPVLLESLLVDRRLAPLGLRRDGAGSVTSRFERDVLYFALLDAHYPVAAEDAVGAIVPVVRPRPARQLAAHGPPSTVDHAGIILERVRAAASAHSSEPEAAWLERQLELAVKSRLRVTVSVAMPNGAVEDYLLEPTGLAAGRLRARDRKADLERTLPLSSIVAVGEAGAAGGAG